MNKTKKVLIITLSLVAILSIFLTYKAYMNKPVMLDDIKYSENTINKKMFGIFVEKDSYSSESDKYEIYSGTTWPSGYELNTTKSVCVDENGETIQNALSMSGSTITLSAAKTAYCYLYFDKPSTPFVSVGTDSTTGLPVVRLTAIPSEEFYDITNAINYGSLNSYFLQLINYDASKTILLAKYNLYVGCILYALDGINVEILSTESGYGLQSAEAKGYQQYVDMIGVVPFSGSSDDYGYWYDSVNGGYKSQYGNSYIGYNIYDTSYVAAPDYSVAFYNNAGNANYSIAYYVEEYVNRLGINGTGRLLTYTEANAMTQTQRANDAYYWLGSFLDNHSARLITSDGSLDSKWFFNKNYSGVRPVIVVDTSSIS